MDDTRAKLRVLENPYERKETAKDGASGVSQPGATTRDPPGADSSGKDPFTKPHGDPWNKKEEAMTAQPAPPGIQPSDFDTWRYNYKHNNYSLWYNRIKLNRSK